MLSRFLKRFFTKLLFISSFDFLNAESLDRTENEISERLGIDKILNIETEPTQITIYTTKEGPSDQLTIKIEVTDLEDRRIFPLVSLHGLFLLLNRGRYTIPFLRPDHYYGIYMQSENFVNGERIFHNETRIVKTKTRNGQNSTNEFLDPKFEKIFHEMFDFNNYTQKTQLGIVESSQIYVHRNDESGSNNTEGVFLTAKWKTEHRLEGSSLLIHVYVKCEHTSADELVVLRNSENGITIEIAMDHRLEIEDLDGNHQIKANIMPLKCKEICWDVTYLMNILGRNFTRDFNQTCDPIKGTSATTFVRELQSYQMLDNRLFVNTKAHSASEKDEERIKLIAKNLVDSSREPIIKEYGEPTFPNGTYVMDLEEEGSIYAITYEYTKLRPFRYSTQQHFMVETPITNLDPNSTDTSSDLLKVSLEPSNIKVPSEGKSFQLPKILLSKGSLQSDHPFSLQFENFCNKSIVTGNHLELDSKFTDLSLDLPLKESFCGTRNSTKNWFCENVTNTCEDTKLCYHSSTQIDKNLLKGPRKCLDLFKQFTVEMKAASKCIYVKIVLVLILAFGI